MGATPKWAIRTALALVICPLPQHVVAAEDDFFKSVPAAGSYVMKHIIHDWDDDRAVQILKNCASAMRGKGKVLLVESVIASDPLAATNMM